MASDRPARPRGRSARDEIDALAREMARDSVSAAREGWRFAKRVGRTALRLADDAIDDLTARRR